MPRLFELHDLPVPCSLDIFAPAILITSGLNLTKTTPFNRTIIRQHEISAIPDQLTF